MRYVLDMYEDILGTVFIDIDDGIVCDGGLLISIITIKSKINKFKDYTKTYNFDENIDTMQEIIKGLDYIANELNVNIDNIKREFLKQI